MPAVVTDVVAITIGVDPSKKGGNFVAELFYTAPIPVPLAWKG